MNRSHLPRRSALLAALLLTALTILAGCSHKITTGDAGYTKLEGVPDPRSLMLVWPETPDTITSWWDTLTVGPAKPGDLELDTLTGYTVHWRNAPGTMHVMLIDGSKASSYQMFRRASNGGLLPMFDYPLLPVRKWLASQWEAYETTDPHPSGYSPATYVGRGLLDGIVTSQSPLSNPGVLSGSLPENTIAYNDDQAPTDSTFNMTWVPTDGATWQGSVAGFWIHVYQLKPAATAPELRDMGTPSPLWLGDVTDNFVGYIPAPAMTFKLGSTAPPGGRILTYTPPVLNKDYYVRITAVAADGHVLAFMSGAAIIPGSTNVANTWHIEQRDKAYDKVPLGAVTVSPKPRH